MLVFVELNQNDVSQSESSLQYIMVPLWICIFSCRELQWTTNSRFEKTLEVNCPKRLLLRVIHFQQ